MKINTNDNFKVDLAIDNQDSNKNVPKKEEPKKEKDFITKTFDNLNVNKTEQILAFSILSHIVISSLKK